MSSFLGGERSLEGIVLLLLLGSRIWFFWGGSRNGCYFYFEVSFVMNSDIFGYN